MDREKEVLEKLELKFKQVFKNTLIDARRKKFELYSDFMTESLVLEARVKLLGKKHHKEIIKYPKNPWNHFKEKYFPNWLKKKFPVKYKKIIFDVSELYPTIAIPNKQEKMIFYVDKKEEIGK